MLRNILTLTHFGVINQAPVHPSAPPSVIASAVHITGACQFLLLFIDSSSSHGGVSITIIIFYEYIFMNILASSPPPPPTTHIHIHIWWSVVFSQLISGQINQRPYLQSICWEGAVSSRRLSNMLDNNRKWKDSTQTSRASHFTVHYVLLVQMSGGENVTKKFLWFCWRQTGISVELLIFSSTVYFLTFLNSQLDVKRSRCNIYKVKLLL